MAITKQCASSACAAGGQTQSRLSTQLKVQKGMLAQTQAAADALKSQVSIRWAANKRFEISKFKFKFPRAPTYEFIRARSRLYRSQILQVNTRWKALDEI